MNELMTLNTTELSNKKLVTQFTRINKAIETGNKSKWTIADSIKTIVVDELYTEDFETEKKLADVFGMSRSNLNKMKNASIYHDEIAELADWTVTKIMEILVIPKDDVEKFLVDYDVNSSDSVKTIREAVLAWKEDTSVVAESEIVENEESEIVENEESEIVENESSTSNNSELKMIDHNDEKYVSFFTFINTLSEDEIKYLITVMEKNGIGDSYALEEVEKLWSKDI
jgi:DNA-binding Xre family transcriptional regulator